MNVSTEYPLSAMTTVDLADLKRLGLTAEGRMNQTYDDYLPFADVLVSGHAPIKIGEQLLNIAATDDDFRDVSIAEHLTYIDMVKRFPRLKQVNMHFGYRRRLDEEQREGREGDYDRLIEAILQIAAYASERNIEVVLENMNSYFEGVPEDLPADQIDWSDMNQAFGSSPQEWVQICEDVDRPNVGLCLDSSHSCTYAHTFADPERRTEVVMSFLAKPHLIRHVHWSDNYLYDPRGRTDSHAILGRGTMPIEMHRAIKGLDATILLETIVTTDELQEQLEFIAGL